MSNPNQPQDQLYIEEDYFDLGYFVFIAEAQAQPAVASTVSCQGETIRGAQSQLAVQATTTTTANTVFNGAAQLEVTAGQQSIISHIQGADLVAFSSAQLSAQFERFRDSAAEPGAVFDVAVDYTRIQQAGGDIAVIAGAGAQGKRLRDAVSIPAAAFLFDSNANYIADFASTINSEFGATAELSTIFDNSIELNSRVYFDSWAFTVPVRSQLIESRIGPAFKTLEIDNQDFQQGTGSLFGDQTGADTWLGVQVTNGAVLNVVTAGTTYTTVDGSSWTTQSNNLPSITIPEIRYLNGFYAFCEFASSNSSQATVWYSTDAVNWSSHSVAMPAPMSPHHPLLEYYNGFFYLAVSFRATSRGVRIFRSTSLTGSWSQVHNISSPTFRDQPSLTAFESVDDAIIWGAQLSTSTTNSSLYWSSNGTAWNFLSNTPGFNSIDQIFKSGSFYYIINRFAIASGGRVWRTSSLGSSWTSQSNLIGVTFENDVWFRVLSTSFVAAASSISALNSGAQDINGSAVVLADFEPNYTQPIYVNGKFLVGNIDRVFASSTATSGWQQTGVSPFTNRFDSFLAYDIFDLNDWRTIDFWFKANGNEILFNASGLSNGLIQRNSTRLQFTGTSAGTISLPVGSVNANQWYHTRLVRQVISTSPYSEEFAWYLDGVRLDNRTLSNPTDFGNNIGLIFRNPGTTGINNARLDEFLITSELLTDPSQQSHTVPTSNYQNTSDTLMLLHFDSDFLDDVSSPVVEAAQLNSNFQLLATGSQLIDFEGQLSTTAGILAVGNTQADINLVAFSDAQLTTDVERIRNSDSSVGSNFDQTVVEDRLRSTSFDQFVIAQQTVETQRFVGVESIVSAEFGFDADSRILQNGEASVAAQFGLTAQVGVIKQAEQNMALVCQLTADNTRILSYTALLENNGFLVAQPVVLYSGKSTQNAVFGLKSTVQRTTETILTAFSDAQVTAELDRFRTTPAVLDVVAQAQGTLVESVVVIGSIASQFAIQAQANVIRDTDAQLLVEVDLQGLGGSLQQAASNLAAEFGFESQGSFPVLGNVYIIPSETRQWQIQSESRTHKITV